LWSQKPIRRCFRSSLRATARQRGARLVNWLQDIYPETAAVLGGTVNPGTGWRDSRSAT
jgi:hypothetical protein